MEIVRAADSDSSARLADFLWSGSEPYVSEWVSSHRGASDQRDASGARRATQRWIERSYFESPGRRIVERYSLVDGALTALEHIGFDIDSERFVESSLLRSSEGPNLREHAMVLPAVLERGEPHHIIEGHMATVSLVFCGDVELRVDDAVERGKAILLRAAQGQQARDQWLLEGVGEVALGDADRPPSRWLCAGVGPGARTLFGGLAVPEQWPALTRS